MPDDNLPTSKAPVQNAAQQLAAARNRISDDAETMNRLCARNGEAAAIIADLMELVALYRKQWKPLSAEDEDIGKALYRAEKFLDAKPERRSIADKAGL